ncbi:S8 family serine peptidase [Neobacillus sp. YIM B06451]|uniref:S8 family peptidase n=1 Tax=Neobacillus sp. YIM B06451 TaxID=3070994 RepID=UPI002931AEE9|nr:S8 family serine peptidase [Neobacillus sp. YIM B06451]
MKNWFRKSGLVAVGTTLVAASLLTGPVHAATVKYNDFASSPTGYVSEAQMKMQQDGEKALSDDTLIIKFKKPLGMAEHRYAGGTPVKQLEGLDYAVVKVRNKKDLDKVITRYRANTKVAAVMPSALYRPLGIEDPKAASQYHVGMLNLAKAQSIAGKYQVTVAVIDQGIDPNHPDLKGKLLPSYNTVTPMNQGSPDFHGTHVAGIIAAAKDNGIGGYGVNPNAKILPIDVFDRAWGASDFAIAEGILYAINKGAKVINMSLGGSMPSPLIEDAIKKALDKNIVVIAAAGNTGNDMLSYPAAYEGVISVGNINSQKKLSASSSYGPSVDVVAPGEDIYSTIYEYERKSSYRKLTGTSMAAPMVAGVASLLLSKYPLLTPHQVEYILEHTAEDLGEKGFDVKYGNGLINPVAALQFDMKKLPDIIKKTYTEKELLEEAQAVSLGKEVKLSGNITAAYEEKWYKAEVEKGDNLQFVLDGGSQFDYKLMIQMYSASEKMMIDVNKVREGVKEGKFFEAPFSGTVLFGVKEVNGSYDNSARGGSKFNLTVQKAGELPEDESSVDKPIQIELPYDSGSTPLHLLGKDGDDDYYKFSVKEPQAVRIELSGVPGTDTTLSLYTADMFFPPDFDKLPADEQKMILDGLTSGEMKIDPMLYSNRGGHGSGESINFTANPEMGYIIKVSNKIDPNYFMMYDFFFNPGLMAKDQVAEPSLVPYKLKVNGKVFPEDEDMFPFMGGGKGEKGEGLEEQKKEMEPGDSNDGEDEFLRMIQESSQPYMVGNQAGGYLQMMEDEDWFQTTPSETGIYQFAFSEKGFTVPLISIFKIIEDKDYNGKPMKYLAQIGSNMTWDWAGIRMDSSLYTGLRKGETYYIKVNSNYYTGEMSFDPYQFTSKLLFDNPQDQYEDNDKPENVRNLPAGTVEGNFAMPFDQDYFYFESKAEAIYGVTFGRKAVDPAAYSKYPKELTNPIFGMVVVVEDINKNRKLDEEEARNVQYIDRGAFSGNTYGSFKAGKNKNYILLVNGYVDGPVPLSVLPYQLKVAPVNTADEDKGSVVKNNIPSKPIKLAANGKTGLKATGYLNAGVPYGDEDWYELKLAKDSKGKIEFTAGIEVDSIISLYKDGKLVAQADYYPEGDAEVLNFSLKKGTYHIKVRDVFGNSTLNPYTLKVTFK